MNREIKFRAWNKGVKKMVLVTRIDWNTTGNSIDPGIWSLEGIEQVKSTDGKDRNDYVQQEDFILMQYTGLKDKSGKEIYEGDIIKTEGGALGVVKWRHFGFEQDMINTLGWWVIQEDGEIIGNIYENPELLD